MFPIFNNQNLQTSQSNNTLLRGQSERAHEAYIKQLLSYIEDQQKALELQWSFSILSGEHRQISAELEECSKLESGLLYDEEFSKEIRDRCARISKDNEAILAMMFNFKEAVARARADTVERNAEREGEYLDVQDRIRRLKMEISNKLQKVRTGRKARKSKPKISGPETRTRRPQVMRLALTELKDAVEVVSRELIRQREEIKVLIKYLYDETI